MVLGEESAQVSETKEMKLFHNENYYHELLRVEVGKDVEVDSISMNRILDADLVEEIPFIVHLEGSHVPIYFSQKSHD